MSSGREPVRAGAATLAVLAVTVAWLLSGAVAAAPAHADSTVLSEIRRFDVPASTSQIIVAHAGDFTTSHATVETFERVDGSWRRVLDPMAARFGATGSVPGEQRVQGSHKTPAGVYGIPGGFGRLDSPGGAMPWRVVDADDYWVYDRTDPATYNTYQTSRTPQARWRTSWAEHLRDYPTQYAHSLILGFNLPGGPAPVDVTAGGGIFLHVNGTGATAGCISLTAADLAEVVRWLDPGADPRIVIGPRSVARRGRPVADRAAGERDRGPVERTRRGRVIPRPRRVAGVRRARRRGAGIPRGPHLLVAGDGRPLGARGDPHAVISPSAARRRRWASRCRMNKSRATAGPSVCSAAARSSGTRRRARIGCGGRSGSRTTRRRPSKVTWVIRWAARAPTMVPWRSGSPAGR